MEYLGDKVVSLKLAKEIKDAGYEQNGEFWWCNADYIDHMGWIPTTYLWNEVGKPPKIIKEKERWQIILGDPKESNRYGEINKDVDYCVAPLVSELLEKLPANTLVYKTDNSNKGYRYYCHRDVELAGNEIFRDDNLADALVKLWLYLKKRSLL